MSTVDLISKIKKTSKKMSIEQRKERLIQAHIIKRNGEYDPKYFSLDTVKNSKKIIATLKA
jgi:hypothetical protein